MRKIYSGTAKCPNTSKNLHYKIAYTSKAFCGLQSSEHNCNLLLVPSGHVRCTITGFSFGGIFCSPRVPLRYRVLKKTPLDCIGDFFPLQWLPKMDYLSHQFCVVNPRLFVLGWLSALHIVFLGRILFKMIPGSSYLEVLLIQEKTYATLLRYH